MTKTMLVVAGLLLAALPTSAQTPAKQSAKSPVFASLLTNGSPAPDFAVQDKDGKTVKLSEYKGKTIVLDFWATWCGTCMIALDRSVKLPRKYPDKNIVVLAINVLDTQSAFHTKTAQWHEPPPAIFAFDSSMTHIAALYHVSVLPTQYLIDGNGKIVAGFVGLDMSGSHIEDALRTVSKEAGGFPPPPLRVNP